MAGLTLRSASLRSPVSPATAAPTSPTSDDTPSRLSTVALGRTDLWATGVRHTTGELSEGTDLDVGVRLITFSPRARSSVADALDLSNEGPELRNDRHQQQQRRTDHEPSPMPAALHRSPRTVRSSPNRRWETVPITTNIDLATHWPQLRRSLLTTLRSRRVDEATAEDICQDVVERALRSTEEFATPDNLRRWATRVALNKATDLGRMQRRHIASEELPDTASPFDMELAVTHRLALSETVSALASLRPEERAALAHALSAEPRPPDRRAQNRENIRRLRARARLRGLVRNFPALIPARWTGWLRRRAVALPDLGPLATAGFSIAVTFATGSPPAVMSPSPVATHTASPSLTASFEPLHNVPTPSSGAPYRATVREQPPQSVSDSGEVRTGRTTLVAVADPTGGTRAGLAENSDKPIVCAVTHAAQSLCVTDPAPNDALPLLPSSMSP